MVERNRNLEKQLLETIRPVLLRHYSEAETDAMLAGMEPIYEGFRRETPWIGGSSNPLAYNLDMALPFFALYEASGRSLTEETVDELLDAVMLERARRFARVVDFNKLEHSRLRGPIHAALKAMSRRVNDMKGGAWNNTWGVEVNPEGHDHGIAMTLVGCPIADFARAHGYLDILHCLCRGDERIAAAMHGRLIRHHTVGEGAKTCDYWYVGDQNTTDW